VSAVSAVAAKAGTDLGVVRMGKVRFAGILSICASGASGGVPAVAATSGTIRPVSVVTATVGDPATGVSGDSHRGGPWGNPAKLELVGEFPSESKDSQFYLVDF
jgi:hypothetical protein